MPTSVATAGVSCKVKRKAMLCEVFALVCCQGGGARAGFVDGGRGRVPGRGAGGRQYTPICRMEAFSKAMPRPAQVAASSPEILDQQIVLAVAEHRIHGKIFGDLRARAYGG